MAKETVRTRSLDQSGPASRFSAVTPDDAATLPQGATRGLYVGGAGTLKVVGDDGASVEFVSGPHQYHPLRVARVLATGTSATGIVALY